MSSILRVSLVLLALSSNVLAGPVSARSDILECIKERTGATLTHSQAQAMRAGQMKPPCGQQQYNDIFDDCCKSSSGDSERQGDPAAGPASGPASDPNVEHPNVDGAKELHNTAPNAPAGPSTPPQHAPAPPSVPEVNPNAPAGPFTPPQNAPAPPSAPEANAPSTPHHAPASPSAPEVNAPAPAPAGPHHAPVLPAAPETSPDNQRQQRPTAEVNGQEGPKDQDAEVNATGNGEHTHDPNAVAGVPIPGAGAEAKEHTGGEAPPAGAKAMEGSPERKIGVTVPDTIEKAEGAPKTGFRQGEMCVCPA